MRLNPRQVIKRFGLAKSRRGTWEDMWQDIYDFAIPQRESFFSSSPGEERGQQIADETAVVGSAEFVTTLQNLFTPEHLRWFRFEPGSEVKEPDARKKLGAELDEVSDFVWDVVENSNFFANSGEVYLDLAVGWQTQMVDDGRDGELIHCSSVPQAQVYWDTGPFRGVDGVFRVRADLPVSEIKNIWPDAVLSESLQAKLADDKATIDVIEATYRNWENFEEEEYLYQVIDASNKGFLVDLNFTGAGSKPFITSRWSTAAGENYGRGPLVNALPAIRTVNMVTELVLENAQMSISGIWETDDDGVINVNNIEIVPGAVFARNPDSSGLRSIVPNSDFSVADLVISSYQENIRKALFNQNFGSVDKTPRSALEVAERQNALASQLGGAGGRHKFEYINNFLRRVVYLLNKQGKLDMPKINGREVRIAITSPLARAQRIDDINRLRGFSSDLQGILGPQQAQLYLNQPDIVEQIREAYALPQTTVRSEDDRKELVDNIAQAAQAGGPGVQDQQEPAPPAV